MLLDSEYLNGGFNMHRYRIIFVKEGDFACLSHLDLQRTFIRALRRAGMPLLYSQGFNPQPRLSFAAPLAVGIAGDGEFLEVDLDSYLESEEIKTSLNGLLPPELAVRAVQEVDPEGPVLASQVAAALYLVIFSPPVPELVPAVQAIMASPRLEVERPGKISKKRVDIRPFIYNLYLQNTFEKDKLFMFLATGNQGGTRPGEVMTLLPLQTGSEQVRRLVIFTSGANDYMTPEGEALSAYLDRLQLNTGLRSYED